MTRKEIEQSGEYKLHHSSKRLGYVSRKIEDDDAIATPYSGKYGVGYVVDLPRWDTTRYVTREYWIGGYNA